MIRKSEAEAALGDRGDVVDGAFSFLLFPMPKGEN